jgi:uncharacterized Zn finger protein
MSTLQLTEAQIRNLASGGVFQRGWDYYYGGAVLRLIQRGDDIFAEVQGSDYEPYQVHVTVEDGDITATSCTCPYDYGDVCKHVVATLLTYLHQSEAIEQRPPVEELLAGLDAEQLRQIMLRLLERQPDLADLLESYVQQFSTQPAPTETGVPAPSKSLPPLNREAIRRQVSAALHASDRMRYEDGYGYGSQAYQLTPILNQLEPYLQAGSADVLEVLAEITEEYVDAWVYEEGYFDEAGDFSYTLAGYWVTALLNADLAKAERRKWASRIQQWQRSLADYGLDDALESARIAAEQGWDDPQIQRALRGEIERGEYREDDLEEDLLAARLQILERQGRNEEYLNLALAAGQLAQYAVMLVKLGRVEEATEVGLHSLATASEALGLAQALHEAGATDAALRVAEHGLSLETAAGPSGMLHASGIYIGEYPPALGDGKVALARWLRDQASAQGQTECALDAALVAARESVTLADYQAVQSLAGERWQALRDELLDQLRQRTSYWHLNGKVDIFLSEELFDDAIAVIEANEGAYELAEKTADALVKHRPNWVVDLSQRHAERIADQAKADRYSYAVRWLQRARDAARVAGREPEFRAYVQQLIAKHKRKYKLVPMLEQLLRR